MTATAPTTEPVSPAPPSGPAQAAAASSASVRATDSRRTTKRTLVVWGVFAAATALAVGALQWTGGPAAAQAERVERPQPAATAGSLPTLSVTPRFADLDRRRWTAIVIHHSGTPGGDAASLERRHLQEGLTGLGYHFIIGNGQGLDDGQVVVGYRWDRQLAGAHVALSAGERAAFLNEHSVAICLIGNGERRPFTDRQIRELAELVRQLQATLGIPAREVHLHSTLSGVPSPGRFFPAAELSSSILP